MGLDKRDRLLNMLTVIQNNIDDNWDKLTTKQVGQIDEWTESYWKKIVNRRGK